MDEGTSPQAEPAPVPQRIMKIEIMEKDQLKLRTLDQKAVQSKLQIFDLTEQIIVLERQQEQLKQQRTQLFDQLYQSQNDFRGQLKRVAAMNGVDVDEPDEHWEFDPASMTMSRKIGNVPLPSPAPTAEAKPKKRKKADPISADFK